MACNRPSTCELHSDLEDFRRLRKLETGRCQLSQDLLYDRRDPVAARRTPDRAQKFADHKVIVKDIDAALAALCIFNNPLRRHPGSVRPDPGIKNKVRNREDSSRPDDFSNARGNEPERRAEPGDRARGLIERFADCLVAQNQILFEPFEVPQIGEPMMERVIYDKMAGGCDRASLFWSGHNLATNQTEASFNAEFV
jgi:hypothetical protein